MIIIIQTAKHYTTNKHEKLPCSPFRLFSSSILPGQNYAVFRPLLITPNHDPSADWAFAI